MLRMFLTGAPYDQGVQHGRKFKELIQERANRAAQSTSTVAQSVVEERLERMVASLRRHVPDAFDELNGIASGAGLPPRDVLLLNFGTEISHEASEWYGCSNVAFATTNDG